MKVDGEDKAKVVPFKQLVVPEKVQKVIQPEAARDKRVPAQDWAVMAPAGADSALNMWVQLGLFHAHSVCSPNMQIVRLHDENGVETWSLENDVKERMLILVPYSSTFEFVRSGGGATCKQSQDGHFQSDPGRVQHEGRDNIKFRHSCC